MLLLLGPDSLAITAARADEIKLDTLGVEASNANIRRTIVRAVQQQLPSLEDICAAVVFRCDRICHQDVFGEANYSVDKIATPIVKATGKMRGGGGGLCRAFISHESYRFRLPNGKLDIAAAVRS